MRAFSLLILALFCASGAAAQDVRVEGARRDSAAVLFQQLLERGNYTLIDRDTTIEAGSLITGDLVIVDSRVSLEGGVLGTVAVVRGDFFIRPRARVLGSILVIDGGAYPSALAEHGDIIQLDPRTAAELESEGSGYGLTLTERVFGILRIPGLFGVQIPRYNRVDGFSPGWGGELGFGGDTASLSVRGQAFYHTERERLGGGVELLLRPSFRGRISIAASRNTRTNEGWIRGTFANSVSTLLGHSDVRDYYESDLLAITIAGLPPPPMIEGESFISPRLTLRLSRDRSVPAGDVWSLLDRGEPWRVNRLIDEGDLGSAVLGAAAGWRGIASTFSGFADVEWSPSGIGDFEFAQLQGQMDWWSLAPLNHEIEVGAYLRYPIGSGTVPRQRWTFVGGPGTLPTLETGALRGDHVLFVQSSYVAGIPRVTLPLVGPPLLRLEYAAGTAWVGGESIPPIEQNFAVGIQLMMFTGMAVVDPSADSFDPTFTFGAELPAF